MTQEHPTGPRRGETTATSGDVDVELLPGLPRIGAGIASALLHPRRSGPDGELSPRRVMVTDLAQDAQRYAAYSRVCGFTLRDTVPATWLHVLTFPLQVHRMAASDFPLALAGLVHIENQMRLHRPVRVDEPLTIASWATDLRGHRSGTQVDLIGEVRAGAELVWNGRSTYLARGRQPSGAAGSPPDQPARPENAQQVDQALAAAGQQPSAVWRLPASLGRAYAAVSGDVNPIHLSALTAKAFGFSRTIAHGMWTHARALAALEGRLPQTYEASVSFRKPVLLPSTVGFASLTQGGATHVQVANADGSRVHLRGSVT